MDDPRENARKLAQAHPTQWFDQLYRSAAGDMGRIPWADRRPNVHLREWLEAGSVAGGGRSCCVMGCGLGDDAELLASRGFRVTAFDISAAAIEWAMRRFPSSRVRYMSADLFELPPTLGSFDFVFESYTIQALPVELREKAIDAVARLVGAGGELLLIARGREPADPPGDGPPWPLVRGDIERFVGLGLKLHRFDDFNDAEGVRRLRALLRR